MTLAGGSNEVSYEANDSNAPLQGMVTVESPLNALKFEMDDNTEYLPGARAHYGDGAERQRRGHLDGREDVNVHGPVAQIGRTARGQHVFHARGEPGRARGRSRWKPKWRT